MPRRYHLTVTISMKSGCAFVEVTYCALVVYIAVSNFCMVANKEIEIGTPCMFVYRTVTMWGARAPPENSGPYYLNF